MKQAAKELAQSRQTDKDRFVDIDVFVVQEREEEEEEVEKQGEFLASGTIVVDVAVGTKGERTRL